MSAGQKIFTGVQTTGCVHNDTGKTELCLQADASCLFLSCHDFEHMNYIINENNDRKRLYKFDKDSKDYYNLANHVNVLYPLYK